MGLCNRTARSSEILTNRNVWRDKGHLGEEVQGRSGEGGRWDERMSNRCLGSEGGRPDSVTAARLRSEPELMMCEAKGQSGTPVT